MEITYFRTSLVWQEEDYPSVTVGLFIEHPTVFLEDFFAYITALSYPKTKMNVLIHYVDSLHAKVVEEFIKTDGPAYRTVRVFDNSTGLTETAARKLFFGEAVKLDAAYYLSVDGDSHLENTETIQLLIHSNKSVVAPMLVRPGKLWSNFWGDLNAEGYYKRSNDYIDIIQSKRIGLWNAPYISGAYLVQGRHLALLAKFTSELSNFDADLSICKLLRDNVIFMYVDNQVYYGHLVDSENMEKTRLHPDLYSIFDNRYTWEKKYINVEYNQTLHGTPVSDILQPCTDVFMLPLVSPTFCKHLVEEMENYGQWSGGNHEDKRLNGGYENVPTVDIHTNQIGWEKHWMHILKEYIVPLNGKVFAGYHSEARAIMNFVVRYRPGEQDRLRPHSDSSMYSINLALNNPQIDYEGGGTRFLRYNCSVIQSRVGWMLMHPGRLTHEHEGLPTTRGTRYIMVSFVDP